MFNTNNGKYWVVAIVFITLLLLFLNLNSTSPTVHKEECLPCEESTPPPCVPEPTPPTLPFIPTTEGEMQKPFPFVACLKAGDAWGNYRSDDKYQYGHDYLTPKSIVFDIGGNIGRFIKAITDKYKPVIYSFEPIDYLYNDLVKNWGGNSKIHLFHHGLAADEGEMTINLGGRWDEASSLYGDKQGNTQIAKLRRLEDVMREQRISVISLISVNCEGCEYSLLEDWIEKGLIHKFCNIQIEFHRRILPESISRRCRIQEVLSKDFDKVYDFPFQWEHWKRKKPCEVD